LSNKKFEALWIITYEGQPTIIAGEVKKGGQVLKLRDAAGVPACAGQGRW
jgi:hypothetical protein